MTDDNERVAEAIYQLSHTDNPLFWPIADMVEKLDQLLRDIT